MSNTKPGSDESELFPDLESLQSMDIDQWIETLQRADRSFYNLMAVEVWSIAKTMDGLLPGFWHRFMSNRQVALKQFIQQNKKQNTNGDCTNSSPTNEESDPG